MSRCFLLVTALNLFHLSSCLLDIIIIGNSSSEHDFPVYGTVEVVVGSNLILRCMAVPIGSYNDAELVWGKKNKLLRFKNESDLVKLARNGNPYLYDLHNANIPYDVNKASLHFTSIKEADQGTYFCMYLKNNVFKVVQIKVRESLLPCKKDKFRCVESGHCINLYYKCDGREDCLDGSDEHFEMCNGDPCKGKISCLDGRCIPTTWCCDILTDDNCTVAVRPSCCAPLLDPYDPTHWYHNQTTKVKEMNRSNGSRYLFISVCVITAILSFVLFLFMISRICGFDKNPRRSRNRSSENTRNQMTSFSECNRCEHSECAIRREFNPNNSCLYRNNLNNTSRISHNELVDPLISVSNRGNLPMLGVLDQPPPYEEVVSLSINNADKDSISDLFNAPPPPYCSTKFVPHTSNNSNHINNQNINCDNVITSDSSICNE